MHTSYISIFCNKSVNNNRFFSEIVCDTESGNPNPLLKFHAIKKLQIQIHTRVLSVPGLAREKSTPQNVPPEVAERIMSLDGLAREKSTPQNVPLEVAERIMSLDEVCRIIVSRKKLPLLHVSNHITEVYRIKKETQLYNN